MHFHVNFSKEWKFYMYTPSYLFASVSFSETTRFALSKNMDKDLYNKYQELI